MTKPHDQKTQAMDQLAEDLVAEEKLWISTPESLFTEVSSLSLHSGKLQIRLLLFTIALSAAVAFIHMSIVQAGYDWGYLLVERICGQADVMDQLREGVWALASLYAVIIPGAFGLAYGACRSHCERKVEGLDVDPILNLGDYHHRIHDTVFVGRSIT